jgi:hypothetical protein
MKAVGAKRTATIFLNNRVGIAALIEALPAGQ